MTKQAPINLLHKMENDPQLAARFLEDPEAVLQAHLNDDDEQDRVAAWAGFLD